MAHIITANDIDTALEEDEWCLIFSSSSVALRESKRFWIAMGERAYKVRNVWNNISSEKITKNLDEAIEFYNYGK